MNARDLAAHLIARLRWAIDRGDDTGMVVRVRTFVAIRHWLLNYFADDFVPSLLFRQEFVKTMNHLTHAVRANGNASDLKIIGELKKCWRRTCALYWDSSENTEAGVDEDITPGGPPGTRDETLSRPQSAMLRIPQLATPPPRLDIADHSSGTESFIRDVVQPRGIAMFEKNEGNLSKERNSAPLRSQLRSTVYSKSSASMQTETASDDNLERKKPSSSHGPSPTKKLRSGPHKRSGSFSDALRDNRYPLPLPNSIVKSTQLLMALPYAGSLVRGNLFPPTPAFVEVIAPSTPVNEPSSFSFGTQINPSSSSAILRPSEKHLTVPNKATGPGMKRLFGSFRKALGVRSTAYSSTSKHEKSAAGESVPVARTSSTRSNISSIEAMAANASKFGMRMSGDGKVARIDLLGAGAVDAFQRAMMEEITYTDQERHDDSAAMTSGDDISRDGGMQGVDTVDGACDGTDVAELGSTMHEVIDHRSEARQSIRVDSKTKEGFLDSPSTSNSSPAGDPESLFGGTSFLADESSPSDSSCDSLVAGSKVRTPSPTPAFEGRSVCVRRSKSFSFGRSSSRFNRTMVNTDGPSSSVACPTGMDVRSLHSARSFSFNRANSMLSQFGSVMDNISEFSEFGSFSRIIEDQATPRALLRRRPGGNLRAVATIGELEQPRPMSTGSINTGTLSLEDTRIPELQMRPRQRTISPDERSSQASGPHPIATRIVSLGAMGRGGGGLLSHPPPIPELPPDSLDPETPSGGGKVSFEAGVQMLRELPDDDGDDGGIEVALAKLEGTYQRKKSGEYTPVFDFRRSIATSESRDLGSSVVVVSEYHDELSGYDGIQDEDGEGTQEQQRRLKRRHKQVLDQVPLQTPPILDSNSSDRQDDKDEKEGLVGDHSEDSISILERGNSISVSQGGSFGGTIKSVPYPSKAGSAIASDPAMVGTSTECDVDSSRLDSKLEMHLEHTNMQEQDDNTSEMSSDLSFEMIQQTAEERTATFPPIMPGTIISELGIPSHPLRHPPSPPLTLEQALSLPNSSLDDPPRTPRNPSISGKDGLSSQSRSTRTIRADTPRRSRESQIFQPTAIHLPFILAYDSELLAKQFTLIEKDALLEVDWKELVDLNWSQADADVKDWVELLNSRDIKGVEVVVARFNLVYLCLRLLRSKLTFNRCVDGRVPRLS